MCEAAKDKKHCHECVYAKLDCPSKPAAGGAAVANREQLCNYNVQCFESKVKENAKVFEECKA